MAQSTSTKKKSSSSNSRAGSARKSNTKSASQMSNTTSEDSMLAEFFIDELKDIYWAEKHLVKALPKLQKASNSEELQTAIANHLEVTKEHVTRLEQVFEMLGKKAQAKKCDAMEGITKEAEGVIEDTEDGTATRNVAIIMAAQKTEHYEIATYGGLVQLAKTLGQNEIADILYSTLEEEKQADQELTDIAENNINYQAASEPTDEEMEEE
jgi:ferritin-like metal-binding protein YciE